MKIDPGANAAKSGAMYSYIGPAPWGVGGADGWVAV